MTKAMKKTAAAVPDKGSALGRFFRAAGKRWIYFVVFFVPVLIMYVAYAHFGVHPYGDNSVLVLDLNGQYVYYYEAMRDALHGDGSLMYDWSRNLSGEMFGVFAYYLASPFMLIICILPRTWMCGAIETVQLAKIGCAALTFSIFLTKRSRPSRTSLVVFSTCYSLMSYMIVQLMDPMWLDGLVWLPLICLGVHRLVNEGKMTGYIIPLALMFIAHFYIGYMIGFFTFCYFVYACLCEEGRKLPKNFFIRCVQFGAATIIAIMCACVVLIPVYNSLKLGKLEFSEPNWDLATQFDFLTFATKLFPMSYDTVYPEGLPMIFCGTAVIMLIPLFFLNTKIPVKEKVCKGALASVLVICMYIRPIDIIWHGFQVPNWLPYRYSFCFSFVIILMAYRAWENSDGFTAKELGGAFFGLFVFLCWCERENYGHFQIFEGRVKDEETHGVIQGIWFAALALVIYFLLIYLWRKYRGKLALSIVVCVAVSLEMLGNAMDTLHKIDVDVAYSKYTSYEPYMSDTRDAVSALKQYDKDLYYRTEATFHRTVNDPIGTNYYGISHSSSTMNAPALKMLHMMGYAYGGHYTKYDGSTYLTDALFDIRYIMDKEDHDGKQSFKDSRAELPEEYTLATHINETNALYKFYRNPYALGLGIVSSPDIMDVELSETDPFMNQNDVFNALLGSDDTQYFTRLTPIRTEEENLSRVRLVDGHMKYAYANESIAECHIDYIVQMDKTSDLYMYLPTKYERSCNIWYQREQEYLQGVNNMDFAGQFFVGDNYSILNIGKFEKDEIIRIRVTVSNDENVAYWSDELFYTFDFEAFEQADAALMPKVMNITKFEDRGLEAECTAQAGELLFTTIPYENGWQITVNGKNVEPMKALDSMIVIPLEEGENKITMHFSPNYFKLAVIVSICGLILLCFVVLFEYKNGSLFRRLTIKAEFRDPPKTKPEERSSTEEIMSFVPAGTEPAKDPPPEVPPPKE